jgi:hypothetical protein
MLSHVRLVWKKFWLVARVFGWRRKSHPAFWPTPPQCWRKAGDARADHSTGIVLAKFGWIA